MDKRSTLNESQSWKNPSEFSKEVEASTPAETSLETHSIANSQDHDAEAQAPDADTKSIVPAPVKVPRSRRRGFLGRLAVLAEVEDPKHYPNRTKWYLTFVVALAAAAAPLGSAIFFRKAHFQFAR